MSETVMVKREDLQEMKNLIWGYVCGQKPYCMCHYKDADTCHENCRFRLMYETVTSYLKEDSK